MENKTTMTQEDKDLLLKDLCTRLPYGVKINMPDLWIYEERVEVLNEIFKVSDGLYCVNDSGMPIDHIKPYLFPLSSMTDEQRTEWDYIDYYADHHEAVDWLNKNHFDFRGLIPKGLAIDCTNLNIY